ncbi:hypothetical protein PG996_012804 [Apiospora saccharicola]|uniref:Uncharacterized protein n=1 Tax=Apiospora saccharicola TaxID=335842 RepID=A0ABR1U3M9_9PEZI
MPIASAATSAPRSPDFVELCCASCVEGEEQVGHGDELWDSVDTTTTDMVEVNGLISLLCGVLEKKSGVGWFNVPVLKREDRAVVGEYCPGDF